jgi:hypothetical protein
MLFGTYAQQHMRMLEVVLIVVLSCYPRAFLGDFMGISWGRGIGGGSRLLANQRVVVCDINNNRSLSSVFERLLSFLLMKMSDRTVSRRLESRT